MEKLNKKEKVTWRSSWRSSKEKDNTVCIKLKHGERLVVDIDGRYVTIEFEEKPSGDFIIDVWGVKGQWSDLGEERIV